MPRSVQVCTPRTCGEPIHGRQEKHLAYQMPLLQSVVRGDMQEAPETDERERRMRLPVYTLDALTMARMPALMASGRLSQASATEAKSGECCCSMAKQEPKTESSAS
jgi:hypothetical protein